MIFVGSFLKNPYISVFSVAKPKNFVIFAFTYLSESSELLYSYFYMNSHSVDSNEVMKH
jgi:hypothetical protein